MFLEKENRTLELKKKVTDNFLKTVSAYANYQDGRVIFGVADNGEVIGIADAVDERQRIENKVNTSIYPPPSFSLNDEVVEGKTVIVLAVRRGNHPPYVYQNNAYRRCDTSTVKVDYQEFRRLITSGGEMSHDQFLSVGENFRFTTLEQLLRKNTNIRKLHLDMLGTLGLIRDGRYTIAAELLADENHNARSRTTVVRFGKTKSDFLDRADFENQSILRQYDGALAIFDKWYPPYESVVGFTREQRILIPREACREAVSNAIVHRRYDINGSVQISMYDDHVEVLSPGGLPNEVSETLFLYGRLSIPRNPTIADIFYRLRIIEKFGTGIARIRDEYAGFPNQPKFVLREDSVQVTLPVVSYDSAGIPIGLEEQIMLMVGREEELSRSVLVQETGIQKSRVHEVIKALVDSGKLEPVGKGRATRYRIRRNEIVR